MIILLRHVPTILVESGGCEKTFHWESDCLSRDNVALAISDELFRNNVQ